MPHGPRKPIAVRPTLVMLNSCTEAVARTHRYTVANNSGEVLRGRGDGVATRAIRDPDRGVGVHEVEDELLVRDQVKAVDLRRRLTKLGDQLSDGCGSSGTLLGKSRAGESEKGRESSDGEHCVVKEGRTRKNKKVRGGENNREENGTETESSEGTEEDEERVEIHLGLIYSLPENASRGPS